MKKSICLFILCFMFGMIFYNFLNAKATTFLSNEDNTRTYTVDENCEFNVVKGCTNVQEFEEGGFFCYAVYDYCGIIENGIFTIKGTISGDTQVINAVQNITYTAGECTKVETYVGDVKVFECTVDPNYKATITLSKELDLTTLVSDGSKSFSLQIDESIYTDAEYIDPDCVFCVEDRAFGSLIATLYSDNPTLSNKDLFFVTSKKNPISLDELVSSLNVTDETDGKITNLEIQDNTYLPESDTFGLGNYSFTVIARDLFGNSTVQNCNVMVVDTEPPVITGKNVTLTYYIKVPASSFTKYFTATDDSCEPTLSIIYEEYTANRNTPGVYNVTCRATDTSGNYSDCTIQITLVDDIKPHCSIQNGIKINTLANYSINDFKKYITIIDEIDGAITDYEIIDLDGYLENTKKGGLYQFQINASDKSNNTINPKFYVSVVDEDFPVIEGGTYTIIVGKDEQITKEQIINLLKNSGQIESIDNVELYSDFFEVENPSGEYELIVNCDGVEYVNNIKIITKDEAINYDHVTPQAKDNSKYYIIAGVLSGCLAMISVLGVVIYKKKH